MSALFNPCCEEIRGRHDQLTVAGAFEEGFPVGTKTEEDGSNNLGLMAMVGFRNRVLVGCSRPSDSGASEKSLDFSSLAPIFFARLTI